MGVYLYLEASQSYGKCYRLVFGVIFRPEMASKVARLLRLS
jgi:hypothetical protein